MITSAMKKTVLRYLSIAMVCTSGIAWGSPKGSQFITLDMLKDPKVLEDTVDDMTNDTKEKQFEKINRVVIPSYYIEFRTVSSGKALKKGFKDISVNAHVTYTNADQAVMEAIANEGLADLKAQFTAAGYEVVEPGDNTATEEYKKWRIQL